MTYDDLLTRLQKILTDPGGDVAVRRLRERFRVVLVDEFQDTDPVQWDIVRLAFGEGATLVLIGDPKQAIYAFRGADVYAYLEAARGGRRRSATLEVNWRSDQGLLEAYDALFGDARLGHEGIAYRSVRAAGANRAPRLLGAPHPRAAALRVVHRDDPTIEQDPLRLREQRLLARATSRSDLAGDLVALLSSGARIERRAEDGAVLGHEPVRPGPRRRARAHAPPGGARARRARRGRDPRGHQRRRQRVRLRARRATGCGCWRRSSARARPPAPAPRR